MRADQKWDRRGEPKPEENPGFLQRGPRMWKMPQKVKLRETTFQPSLSKVCLEQAWIQKRESFKLSFP